MISVSKNDYVNWRQSDSTKHLVEYLEELRSDFIEGIGTGKFPEGTELQQAIGNYQTLRIIIDYITKDFLYHKELSAEELENYANKGGFV